MATNNKPKAKFTAWFKVDGTIEVDIPGATDLQDAARIAGEMKAGTVLQHGAWNEYESHTTGVFEV